MNRRSLPLPPSPLRPSPPLPPSPPSPRPAAQQTATQAVARVAAVPAVQQVGSAALQLGASCAAFNLTLAGAHFAAGCLRISCATPLLGPLWGLASVASASAAAGTVSRATLASLQVAAAAGGDGGGGGSGGGGLRGVLAAWPEQLVVAVVGGGREAAVDAVLGALLFKLLLGRDFSRLLPSDLARPGAFGRMHVPTSAAEYSTAGEKAQLSVIFGRDGCHHCGTRSNGVIGDHMPPYKVVRDTVAAREAAVGLEKLLAQAASAIGLQDHSLKQVYFAQCRGCSGKQAQLMRNGTRSTLLPGLWPPHLVAHTPARLAGRPALPGVLVGMRYYIGAAVRPYGRGPGGSGGDKEAGATHYCTKVCPTNLHRLARDPWALAACTAQKTAFITSSAASAFPRVGGKRLQLQLHAGLGYLVLVLAEGPSFVPRPE
ncbi:hypothetical protein TSOC_001805 [Tetrabaena socialis]|uniref:Uncharacterized protein n=1 Tax=Tetrabaena socialis TaxID=47790 RepID=A0A2J8AFU0_9CHLO|nr:hypothetical protein TSOC_001805 [Tetrabaena socialis]|eukprot:PNH11387.1 hypothetical protein TSOC_001805 [Tetrabaena socialis]